eukprot:Skav204110  [mRNA]  locus=scaffold5190:26723:33699:- [translate_table: standard]
MRQESAQMTRLMDRLREVGYDELGSPFSTHSAEASSPGEDLTESPDTQKIKAQLVDMHRHLKISKKMYRATILMATLGFFAALMLLPELVASGLLAYSFGLRHAVDVDHIEARLRHAEMLRDAGRWAEMGGVQQRLDEEDS